MPDLGEFEIGIVGNGLSGHLVLKWLLDLKPDVKVALFNRTTFEPIEGPAYLKNAEAQFFLNTPSNRISLSEENSYDFCEFLGLTDEVKDWHFASRSDYGKYAKTKLEPIRNQATSFSEAVAITKVSNHFEVTVNEGKVHCAQIVIATGNDFTTPWQGVINHPWLFDFSLLKSGDEVIVIGTGLTMFDITGAIADSGKEVKITAFSKSGLMPAQQPIKAIAPIIFEWDKVSNMPLLLIFKQLRNNIKASNGEWWRAIDGLRPVTVALWKQLSVFEKQQFINHLLSKWNRVRHRAPEQVYAKVSKLLKNGKLTILKSRVAQASSNYVKLEDGKIMKADYVFYAGGSNSNPLKSEDLLWKQLASENWITAHESGLGLHITPDFNLVGKDSEVVKGAYTIGNNMRGTLLECTAIPELKVHAKLVAEQLLKK